ncbi:ADP-ribosylglycohydrolase family protein [Nocardiopsis tropica]|uniref:ADP-ribosylglycohydrolase family protein n=1 Tax=Nocardiopsis tropica TaxID=109330 RepID=A0ABU7KIP4_9ACTN|nr:ADP-ribosylglycohydrolase family protein [Nocardiopsis umidischolae]MEE2048982.1 ADP-ribosylglycohydrolase family protein [Nocardiopsis umidischolae]
MPNLQFLAARSRGVLLCAAVGDALGWPQEQNSNIVGGNRNRYVDATPDFRDWARYGGGQYQPYIDLVSAGSYSDDTQLMLATGRTLQSEDWFAALTRRELPLLLLYSRGAGGATLRACRTWSTGTGPWVSGTTQKSQKATELYFRAGGNGVAMRIAPHVIMHATRPTEELVARVVQDGIATHGHPRALVGAAAYAVALHALVNTEGTLDFGELPARVEADKSWQSPEMLLTNVPSEWMNAAAKRNPNVMGSWTETVNEIVGMLSLVEDVARAGTRGDDLGTLERLGAFNKRCNGSGTITAAAAIYLASRNAPRPMSGLLRAAFAKNADTDTLASMTGALLGALHGPDWLADLRVRVQDHEYIERMADDLTVRSLGEERPIVDTKDFVHDRSIRQFKGQLQVGHAEGPVKLPDMRQGRLVSNFELESRGNNHAHRWVVEVDGQTLFIDKSATPPDVEVEDYKRESRAKETTPDSQRKTNNKTTRQGGFVGLTLRVSDLNSIASFYSEALGVVVERMGPHEILVGGTVKFLEDPYATFGMSIVLLTFEVPDVAATARRVGHGSREMVEAFRSTDPAGHDLDIRSIRK